MQTEFPEKYRILGLKIAYYRKKAGMAEARVKYRNPGLFRAQFCKKETVPSFISSHT